jgi:hypothetical protein
MISPRRKGDRRCSKVWLWSPLVFPDKHLTRASKKLKIIKLNKKKLQGTGKSQAKKNLKIKIKRPELIRESEKSVLGIRDVYPGSQILIFTHPGSRIPDPGSQIPDPGSRISDPGSRIQKQEQKRGVKKNLLSYLFL